MNIKILITRRRLSSVEDVRTFGEAYSDSDHYSASAMVKQKIKKIHEGTIQMRHRKSKQQRN